MPSTDRDDNDDDDDQNSLTASKEKERKRKVLQFDLINSRCTQEDRWRLRAIHFWFLIRFRVFSIYAFCPLLPLLFAAAVGAPYIHFFFVCLLCNLCCVLQTDKKSCVSQCSTHQSSAIDVAPRRIEDEDSVPGNLEDIQKKNTAGGSAVQVDDSSSSDFFLLLRRLYSIHIRFFCCCCCCCCWHLSTPPHPGAHTASSLFLIHDSLQVILLS